MVDGPKAKKKLRHWAWRGWAGLIGKASGTGVRYFIVFFAHFNFLSLAYEIFVPGKRTKYDHHAQRKAYQQAMPKVARLGNLIDKV